MSVVMQPHSWILFLLCWWLAGPPIITVAAAVLTADDDATSPSQGDNNPALGDDSHVHFDWDLSSISTSDRKGDNNDERRHFVSATLGSNMVLQRDRESVLWGFSSQPGAVISIQMTKSTTNNFKKKKLRKQEILFTGTTTASSRDGETPGLWRQVLPAQPAALTPVTIEISSTAGERATLTNILFGDVYICGGQSNMQFSLPATTNATQEAARANQYPHIRLFTVGQGTRGDPNNALLDLQTVEQNWTVANEHSVKRSTGHPDQDAAAYFSSVCWFFGREVADGLQNQVPIGLISNNWGGTPVESWMAGGVLFNTMIHPYLVGPMALRGFTWYQGEANTKDQASANAYAHNFPTMIATWRNGFGVPDAYFGFIQLSTWCPDNPIGVAELRMAQMAAMDVGKTGYATNADHGWGCNIHPPPKQYCGQRLGRSALALEYDKKLDWKSPTYSRATRVAAPRRTIRRDQKLQVVHQVVIELQDVTSKGLYLLEEPYNSMGGQFNCTAQNEKIPGTCAWASLLLNDDRGWVNATINLVPGAVNQISLTALTWSSSSFSIADSDDSSVLATSYGWGAVPMLTLYDAGTNLPVLPWKETLRQHPIVGA